jgi:hypothetical protein
MVGKSRWFRMLKQFPVSGLPAQKLSALGLRNQAPPGLGLSGLGLSVLLILLLIVPFAVGCSRPSDLPADERVNRADQRKLPFENSTTKGNSGSSSAAGNSGEANPDPVSNSDPGTAGGPPFQTPSSVSDLPPGTLVTVRVESQISIDRTRESRTGEEGTFAGVVDEPVVMDGKIAVPRGATVTGRIEAAPASDVGRGRGYIRLTLDTITITGKTLPLRTSSLFVRGNAGEALSPGQNYEEPAHPTVARLQKGRRLTFRLAATVARERQEAVSSSQTHPTSTE